MLISLQWLNEYLDRPIDADEADTLLTAAGFPLDGIEPVGDDTVLDVEVTSNRPDCLSHIGVAREVVAASDRTLKHPTIELNESAKSVDELTSVENQADDLCAVYTARVIRGVTIEPSPDWLQNALESIGLRPVNNVVDITNYALHEMGQPLHAFDMNKLAGGKIVVRRATKGEPFTAIDGSEHKLRDTMLVIADQANPVAVAGVMGGLDSEVGDDTTDVLLESASFDPLNVRTTSRALKLSSDSSYRFERGVDPAGVERASQRAAALIVQLAGGELAKGVIRVGQPEPIPHDVTMRISRCNALLGYDVPTQQMVDALTSLELSPVVDGDAITCTVPPHRLDLHREADLIEEVARTAAYDSIPIKPKMELTVRPPQPMVQARREVGRMLVAHGYHETITFSNIAPAQTQSFIEPGHELITLEDERAAESALRPSLLPSLLGVRKTNQDAGNRDVKLFEIARTFSKKDGTYHEMMELALLTDVAQADSVQAIRGTIEELTAALGFSQLEYQQAGDATPKWAQAAGMVVNPDDGSGRIAGCFGRVNAATLKQFGLKVDVDVAWLDYDYLTANYPPTPIVAPLARFPGIERDLSVVVDEQITWSQIQAAVTGSQPDMLDDVAFMGVYRGKQVGKGRKSVSFRMRFSHPDKTLRHEEVDPQVESVVESLKRDTAAELRAV
jgi:phenylalanyl-tRNA synthetase beta chain